VSALPSDGSSETVRESEMDRFAVNQNARPATAAIVNRTEFFFVFLGYKPAILSGSIDPSSMQLWS